MNFTICIRIVRFERLPKKKKQLSLLICNFFVLLQEQLMRDIKYNF